MASFIVRSIPNTITCCNLISGCIATMMAFQGDIVAALTFIIVGAIFDFLDGFSARLLHVSSSIGKELDSLADDITFGLAPAAIVFHQLSVHPVCNENGLLGLLPLCAFLIAAFSALRLAIFNLDTRQTTSFIGLPTPANALFWGAFMIGFPNDWLCTNAGLFIILTLTALSCWLLVSNVPMFALKFKNFSLRDNWLRYMFLVTSLILIVLLKIQGIAWVIVWYIVLSTLTQKNK